MRRDTCLLNISEIQKKGKVFEQTRARELIYMPRSGGKSTWNAELMFWKLAGRKTDMGYLGVIFEYVKFENKAEVFEETDGEPAAAGSALYIPSSSL
jgi:hypothetical protein